MTIITADWIVTCDQDNTIIQNGSIAFDTKIHDIGNFEEISPKYPNAKIIHTNPNSILFPGLINPHVHLEFSANKTTLKYGNFMTWLNSVIEHRAELIEKADTKLIKDELNIMLNSGITTIGAISSYGFDTEALSQSSQNIVHFCEIIGSNAAMIDTLFADFKARLNESLKLKNDKYYPAIAIHSPYSVHPFLIRESIKVAIENNLAVSAHFLESNEEKEWLENSTGGMLDFFKNFLNQTKSVTKSEEFLNQFKGLKNISFTHCCCADENELQKIDELNGTIIHCPTSNRFLTNNTIEYKNLENRMFALGTDGLSSNYSLSLWDEMRNALFIHKNINIIELSQKLIKASTVGSAKALGFNQKGSIINGYDADIITITLPDSCTKNEVILQSILHTSLASNVFIKGEQIV